MTIEIFSCVRASPKEGSPVSWGRGGVEREGGGTIPLPPTLWERNEKHKDIRMSFMGLFYVVLPQP
jgi:hypothetical protein